MPSPSNEKTGRPHLQRDSQKWVFDWVIKETGNVFHFQSDGRGRLPRNVRNHDMISKHMGLAARRLEKMAETEAEARACLDLLAGRRHRVYGGIAVIASGKLWQRCVVTMVRFARLSDADKDAYIAAGEWKGKAGAYAIQGHAAAFVRDIAGSYSNVVGLDLHETAKLLRAASA